MAQRYRCPPNCRGLFISKNDLPHLFTFRTVADCHRAFEDQRVSSDQHGYRDSVRRIALSTYRSSETFFLLPRTNATHTDNTFDIGIMAAASVPKLDQCVDLPNSKSEITWAPDEPQHVRIIFGVVTVTRSRSIGSRNQAGLF